MAKITSYGLAVKVSKITFPPEIMDFWDELHHNPDGLCRRLAYGVLVRTGYYRLLCQAEREGLL